ncbi:Protein of unknown function (DUF1838) [Seminavis robusta]|uniref:DUF1838 domain-containing protein n=1 Tax=Seminavis robusta TaxID=568900 RepID=A0A9N8DMM0_9STRA|nr:Protein of unknown function (DUF1838) [Seminavis robusta]|eukprot:Sro228_g092620.1 Protein of unknown function (DUF1838) (321) ;mRNA; r:29655-30617
MIGCRQALLLWLMMMMISRTDALATSMSMKSRQPTSVNGNNINNNKPQPQEKVNGDNVAVNSLDAWVQLRSGIRPDQAEGVFSDVFFWTADGELYESPSGKMVARIEGVEASHAVRLHDNMVRIFSRKLVWFLDPDTYEIMDSYQGKPVKPIRYDAQVFDFEIMGKKKKTPVVEEPLLQPIQPYVVRSARVVPCMPITPRWGGCSDILMFQVPLFIDIDIPLPNGQTRRYQAWEFYDYYLDHSNANKKPPVLSWMRQGNTPPFCMEGNGVMHARGHRVSKFQDLPETTQEYVNENYPHFRGPPNDMEEVDRLLGEDEESS